jgi:hypothetical protein
MSDYMYNLLFTTLRKMLYNRLDNYIIPGLSSELVGGVDGSKVRLFTATREARDWITPHSHRFEFAALVLKGVVHQTLFTPPIPGAGQGDQWCRSTIDQVCGADGIRQYNHTRETEPTWWVQRTWDYEAQQVYRMEPDQIHSIVFEKGTQVLMFEGPQVTSTSVMLEPWVNGKIVPTFRTEPWMFEKVQP